jgi:type VI secretion system lysozyme-like protein
MAFMEKFGRRSGLQAENSELNSILSNLKNILNTRKGYGSILRDFGIRDMNEYISRDHIALVVIEEVKANIKKYEPRVELVSMTRVDDKNPLRLSFQIECRLQETRQSLRMVLDTVNSAVTLGSP